MAYGIKVVPGEKAGLTGGQAAIQVVGMTLTVAPDALRFVLGEDVEGGRYLSHGGWGAEPIWLAPEHVDADGKGVTLVISGDIAGQIAAGTRIKFGLSTDGQSFTTTGRFFWPQTGDSGAPAASPTAQPPAQAAAPPAPPPAVEPPAETPAQAAPAAEPAAQPPPAPPPPPPAAESGEASARELAAAVGTDAEKKKGATGAVIKVVAALVVLAILGGGGWYLYQNMLAKPPRAADADRSDVRKVVKAATGPEAKFLEAEAMIAKDVGKAFLIYRQAFKEGHAKSATVIGRMYDPVAFGQAPTPFSKPNPRKAADWYKKAKDAGDAEGGQSYDALVNWLKTAAAGGDQDAATVLKGLQ